MTKSLFVALAFVAALLAACAGAPLRESAPESVLSAREAALIERDVEKILAMFADDAVVTTSSGRRLIGKDEIRVWVKDQRTEANVRRLVHTSGMGTSFLGPEKSIEKTGRGSVPRHWTSFKTR